MARGQFTANQEFIEKYLAFCSSPLRSRDDILADLSRLSALPMVKLMAFANESQVKSTLMIGLKPLVIVDPKTNREHFIGNFIVYITRYREYPVWTANFRLVNLNPAVCEDGCQYYHPHMSTKPDSELDTVAHICISEGRFPIYQYIRRGQLDAAMELIINLLHSLGPNAAFMPINEWPIARFWRKKRWPFQKTQEQ